MGIRCSLHFGQRVQEPSAGEARHDLTIGLQKPTNLGNVVSQDPRLEAGCRSALDAFQQAPGPLSTLYIRESLV